MSFCHTVLFFFENSDLQVEDEMRGVLEALSKKRDVGRARQVLLLS